MKKAITITLSPISVVVEGNTDKELIENAKTEIIKQMELKFPHFSYAVDSADALTLQNVFEGAIVETKEGAYGIITGVNKKTINVTLTGGRGVQGAPQAFKSSDISFEKARSKRRMHSLTNSEDGIKSEFLMEWSEGETGYLKAKDGVKEVVIGKKAGKKRYVYIVNGKGARFTLTDAQLESFLKDERSEIK